MTLEELTTIEKLNNAFKECSKISHWKESTQRYKANMLLRNTELQNELRSGEYKIGGTIDFRTRRCYRSCDGPNRSAAHSGPVRRRSGTGHRYCSPIAKVLFFFNYALIKRIFLRFSFGRTAKCTQIAPYRLRSISSSSNSCLLSSA